MVARPGTLACSKNPQPEYVVSKVQANAAPDGTALAVVVLPEDCVAPASLALASPPPPPHAAVNETAARSNAIVVSRIPVEMFWDIFDPSKNLA
jgi:hypothetical protein